MHTSTHGHLLFVLASAFPSFEPCTHCAFCCLDLLALCQPTFVSSAIRNYGNRLGGKKRVGNFLQLAWGMHICWKVLGLPSWWQVVWFLLAPTTQVITDLSISVPGAPAIVLWDPPISSAVRFPCHSGSHFWASLYLLCFHISLSCSLLSWFLQRLCEPVTFSLK